MEGLNGMGESRDMVCGFDWSLEEKIVHRPWEAFGWKDFCEEFESCEGEREEETMECCGGKQFFLASQRSRTRNSNR